MMVSGRVPSEPGSRASTEPQSPQGLGPPGFDPSRSTIHLRNGRAQRHPQTFGDGKTWCGKKLLGKPETTSDGLETFTSYGAEITATIDPSQASCTRCSEAFDAAYSAAFPEGPKPIATFRFDSPEDMERAGKVLSAEAMKRYFGPGGGGVEAFVQSVRDSDGSPKGGDAEGGSVACDDSAGPKDIAQPSPLPTSEEDL